MNVGSDFSGGLPAQTGCAGLTETFGYKAM